MKNGIIYASIISLLLFANGILAKSSPNKFPHGCREVGFQFSQGNLDLTMITPDGLQQTLYFIHNKSISEIVMKNAVHSKYIPTYEKSIPQNQWTSFARDVNKISFSCSTAEGQPLDCGEVLEICNYNNVKFPDSNFGTYWVNNPGTLQETIRGSIHKGILLRW